MRQFAWGFSIFFITILLMGACTDPTTIGADLLEGDEAEVGFTDTLSLKATTISNDSVLTYFPVTTASQSFVGYLLGDMQDPIFGRSKSQIYAQVAPRNNAPDLTNARLDSIVLVLPYDTAGIYGDRSQMYGISVHRLTEYINPDISYYSNASFSSDAAALGTANFVPSLDSVRIFDYINDRQDTVKVPPQLRIPLNRSLGEAFLKLDSTTFGKDSIFARYFNGLHLKPSTLNQGMLSFKLVDNRAGIFIYYTKKDTTKTQIHLTFDPFFARVNRFDHDRSNALVNRYVNNPALGDSLLFIQGMSGVTMRLEVPFVETLKGSIVNKAELEFRIASPPGDDASTFKPVSLLLLTSPDKDGNLIAVNDFVLLSSIGNQAIYDFYGGIPLNGKPGEPKLYKINLSSHFQSMINKKQSNVLYLTVFDRTQQPKRTVLYGTKHPLYAAKLKVAYTKL